MLNFYPGPSKLNPQVRTITQTAFDSYILEYNHRSPQFELVFARAVQNIRNYLSVPEDYSIQFVSSATECWEIIAQSFTKAESTHLYNGDFGEKWASKTALLKKTVTRIPFTENEVIPLDKIKADADVICITSCETSNGTKVAEDYIERIKKDNPNSLIAIDATSSLGGFNHDISNSDIWFASVQKCFGLPAGLAILITSSKAKSVAIELNEDEHYNSFVTISKNSKKLQTTHTPNILGIYILSELIFQELSWINEEIQNRIQKLVSGLDPEKFTPLITTPELRSETVLCLQTTLDIDAIFHEAKEHNILLGKGYGKWKENTIRIANFSNHKRNEFEALADFFHNL